MNQAKGVDAYVEGAPEDARPRLREMRAAIRGAAPDAVESISYGMPFYSFRGESGFQARLCYFALLKSGKVAFYTRPVVIEEHAGEAEPYLATKSALRFPLNRPVPVRLIKKLVKTGIRKHEAGADSSHRRRA